MAFDTLQLRIAAEKSIQAAMAHIMPLRQFATSFSAAESNIGASIQVPVFDASYSGTAADLEFNASTNNYAGTGRLVDGVQVNIDNHLVKSARYSDRDFVECNVPFFEDVGVAIGRTLGRGILEKTMGLCTTTTITQTSVFSSTDAKSKEAIANLYAIADENNLDPAECNVIVTPAIYAKILSTLDANVYGGNDAIRNGLVPGLYGFSSVASCGCLSTGLTGLILHREALGIAGRVLPPDPAAYSEVGVQTDEKSGLSIGFRRFAVPETGYRYLAGEVLFGAKLIQPNAAVTLTAS